MLLYIYILYPVLQGKAQTWGSVFNPSTTEEGEEDEEVTKVPINKMINFFERKDAWKCNKEDHVAMWMLN